MYKLYSVTGHVGGECFLAVSDRHALLFDTGFDFCAERTAVNIRDILGGRSLEYIFLSHSHYDHVAGTARIKLDYPSAQVVASAETAAIFARDGARRMMRKLDRDVARSVGIDWDAGRINSLAVDRVVSDGDVIALSDTVIEVLATPGHTRCSVSYFLRDAGILACSETTGISLFYPVVEPTFIVGCRMSLEAVDRCAALRADRLIVSHSPFFEGGMAREYFTEARNAILRVADFVMDCSRRGMDNEEIVQACKAKIYDGRYNGVQPERAFLLNCRAMVPRLLEEMGAGGSAQAG